MECCSATDRADVIIKFVEEDMIGFLQQRAGRGGRISAVASRLLTEEGEAARPDGPGSNHLLTLRRRALHAWREAAASWQNRQPAVTAR